jgi:hypothetical protein
MICRNQRPSEANRRPHHATNCHCGLNFWLFFTLSLAAINWQARAATTVLHLKNGDRIAGTIVSEDTNHVVITTSWIKDLSVPLIQIEKRELLPETPANKIAVADQKPASVATTNAAPKTNAAASVVVTAPVKPTAVPKKKHWKGEAKVGADFLYGAKDQQTYYGRFKLTYEHPYESDPKHFFRNVTEFGLDYGRTEGVLSADRMDGSDKVDLDFGKRKLFVYNLGAAGYDRVRKIDLHYEIGPGLGYHVLACTNLTANMEAGASYQVQYRSDGTATNASTSTENFYFRFAEDFSWKINKTLAWSEKFEFFPQVEDLRQFRSRFETTLSYGIWQNVSLNLSMLNLYDTRPARGVPNNDLQIRSSVGVTF